MASKISSSCFSSPHNLLTLPDDILCQIFQYFHFIELIPLHRICRTLYSYLSDHPVLYHQLIQQVYFPCYQPFQNIIKSSYHEKKILTKWFRKQFHWNKIGSMDQSFERYLHRATTIMIPGNNSNNNNNNSSILTFGGVNQAGLCTCDLLTFTFTENDELMINKIKYQDENSYLQYNNINVNINPLTPSNNSAYAMCSDNQNHIYLYGGRVLREENPLNLYYQFVNDLWQYNYHTNQWLNINSFLIPQDLPPRCWGHSLVHYRHYLFLFGGSHIGATYNDLWILDLNYIFSEIEIITSGGLSSSRQVTVHWKKIPIPAENRPLPRGGHCAIVMNSFMYIFGGNDVNNTYSDFWKIDLQELVAYYESSITTLGRSSALPTPPPPSVVWNEITKLSSVGYPSPRIGHTITSIGSNYFLLYGGRNYLGGTMASGFYLYNVNQNEWSDITPDEYNPEFDDRTGHCCLPTPKGLIYIGGLTGSSIVTSDIYFLDLFSSYEMQYDPHDGRYHYIASSTTTPSLDQKEPSPAPSSSSIIQHLTSSLSQYFHPTRDEPREIFNPIRVIVN